METVKGLCTAETRAKAVQLPLLAKGNSATPAFFSVVPLTVGKIPITIIAFDQDSGHSDSIRKNLNVVVCITNRGQALHKLSSNATFTVCGALAEGVEWYKHKAVSNSGKPFFSKD